MHVKVLLLLILLVSFVNSKHVVFVHLVASKSHIGVTWPIATALEAKGHDVTYITVADPPETHPNITVIMPKETKNVFEAFNSMSLSLDIRVITQYLPLYFTLPVIKPIMLEALLSNPEVQEWMSRHSVDLFVVDNFPEFALGMAYKLKSKVALFTSVALLPDLRELTGVTVSPASTFEHPSRHPMSFLGRLRFLVGELLNLIFCRVSDIWVNRVNRNFLNMSYVPSVDELRRNISVVLYAGYPLEEMQKALPPNYINIAGIHIQSTNHPLPEELEEFVSSSPKGFVYISLGTLVDLNSLSESTRSVFMEAIRAFPDVNFVWKWDVELPKNVPVNVKFVKWLPQQDLLGHSRILGFITQAGRPSSQEAMYHGVPMIIFPVLGDQDYNAVTLEEIGVSINFDILKFTSKELISALSRLVDGEFRDRCEEVARIVKDVPMRPMDTAVWWIEYVLRHNSTAHLQPLHAVDQSFIQRRNFDSAFVLLTLFLLVTYFNLKVLKYVFGRLLRRLRSDDPKKQKSE